MFDLTGRSALVTGSVRGLGREMARGLATAGAQVILNGRNQATLDTTVQELRDEGLAVSSAAFDVTDLDAAAGGDRWPRTDRRVGQQRRPPRPARRGPARTGRPGPHARHARRLTVSLLHVTSASLAVEYDPADARPRSGRGRAPGPPSPHRSPRHHGTAARRRPQRGGGAGARRRPGRPSWSSSSAGPV